MREEIRGLQEEQRVANDQIDAADQRLQRIAGKTGERDAANTRILDAKGQAIALHIDQEPEAPQLGWAAEIHSATTSYMDDRVAPHNGKGDALRLSEVHRRLEGANARKGHCKRAGSDDRFFKAASNVVKLPINKEFADRQKETMGLANVASDLSTAQAGFSMAGVKYKEAARTRERSPPTSCTRRCSTTTRNASRTPPAAVDKPARRDALAEVYGADHDKPARSGMRTTSPGGRRSTGSARPGVSSSNSGSPAPTSSTTTAPRT